MKTSARNQLVGTVKNIKHGAVNDEVMITLSGGQELSATITCDSREYLDLKNGDPVVALIKSTSIIIATDASHIKLSARNQLTGTISNISRGAVYSLVEIDVGNNVSIIAGITIESTDGLDLHPGQTATALFKAGSVILGVPA
ncbi:MAG: TOBE domain-containing protein [Neisseria sp.]|nr:TOBE domain-containing protein [Neisseria sp.]